MAESGDTERSVSVTSMPGMTDAARRAWATTRIRPHEQAYRLISLPPSRVRDAAQLLASSDAPFVALVAEPAEVALTLPEDVWAEMGSRFPQARVDGPYRAITLDVELPLDLVGYLAPAAVRLADAGVGIVPQCGYRTDHLLVHADDLPAAVDVLDRLIRDCQEG